VGKIPKAVYTKEFKEEAVKLVRESGLSIEEVGRRLSVSKSTLWYWVQQTGKGIPPESHRREPVTPEEMEVARLRREVAELKMEREILKKAAAYFAKESLPGTRS
jgi:transposase